MMRKLLASLMLAGTAYASLSQPTAQLINPSEVSRILGTLSADDMQGRYALRGEGIHKAAAFIADEFKKAGLQPLAPNTGYEQPFTMYSATVQNSRTVLDGQPVAPEHLFCQTNQSALKIGPTDGYEVVSIGAADNFLQQYRNLRGKTNNLLVLVDTAHRNLFDRIKRQSAPRFAQSTNQLYVLTANTKPGQWLVDIDLQLTTTAMKNVAGVLPGKSKAQELVVFSGHYDHIGIQKPNEKGDSIYNGANDDASGITAVILLARYFKALNNNERTLVFVAFTAEEVGGYGSQYFSKQLDPALVMAMFNIEMIGTDSKWGTKSAFITGYEKSDMGKLLEKNLAGTGFQFYPDPYPEQQLFYRSDNATLARLGVPAHTISTSKMDNEPHYHKASDEIGTLDTNNMAEIIKAIALSSRSIVAGTDTPTRVNAASLQR